MLLLYNGKLHACSPAHTALAIDHQRIVAIGSDMEILNLSASDVTRVNLGGRYVMPGLTDSHIHLELYGLSLNMIDCANASRAQCLERVKAKAQETPPGRWIRGHGWNQNQWGGVYGNASDLDAVAPDHPVFLTDISLHSAWVNSRALERAGMHAGTPDPVGGIIQRDPSGKPTGILFEKAVDLVEKTIPAQDTSQIKSSLLVAQQQLLRYGITSVHDFDRISCFKALQELDLSGELTLRICKGIPVEQLPEIIETGIRGGFGSSHLRIGPVKMFADGALGPQTAAMLEPYESEASNYGTLLLHADEILETGQLATLNGLSLAVHAIGDRATQEVLNGFAMLRQFEQENHLPHLNHRIEHLQLLSPRNLDKPAQLGIWASMQPVHLYMDMDTADRKWGSRARYAYALQSLLLRNTRLIFGSDAPVECPNPFWGIHAAINRAHRETKLGTPPWYPQERINLSAAINGYTINPALQTGWDRILGSLAPGKLADLVVLDLDPFSIPPGELHALKPCKVMVDGKWVVEDDPNSRGNDYGTIS